MAELIDAANDLADHFLQVHLVRKMKQIQERRQKPSAQICDDCDDPIPVARQLAEPGCDTCISCQELRERRR